VTIGETPEPAAAEELANLLAKQGIRGRVSSEGGRFSVEVGSFANEDDAIDLARELQKRNYPPRIRDLQQKTTLYLVRLGSYASRDEALALGKELESKGFRYFVVKN
jgi:cell division septation protein DedD